MIRKFLLFVHLVTFLLLLATPLNAFFPPSVFPGLNLLSLAFPALMILNLMLCLAWILLWKKRAALFIAASLLLVSPVRRWVNYSQETDEKANLRIVSGNFKSLHYGREETVDYLNRINPDIIMTQEVSGEFPVSGYPYRTTEFPVVTLSSKTEIIREGAIESEGVGHAFFADINCNGKTVRFINVYLTPFSFDKGKVKPGEDFDQNKSKVKYILKRLIPVFRIHQREAETIRKAVENSPYPVILAGDFNAVPNSYEYYSLLGNLQDVFVTSGTGSATSFHDYKIPIRIDYVFASESITALRYTVDRSVMISDHYPVITEFKID